MPINLTKTEQFNIPFEQTESIRISLTSLDNLMSKRISDLQDTIRTLKREQDLLKELKNDVYFIDAQVEQMNDFNDFYSIKDRKRNMRELKQYMKQLQESSIGTELKEKIKNTMDSIEVIIKDIEIK